MNKFGYIINPKDAQFYRLAGGLNKIKLSLPLIKDEVMKISEIYDKNNCYIGDILSVPQKIDIYDLKEKLLGYIDKNNIEFICLGDLVRQRDVTMLEHHKLITGVQGMAYVSIMFLHKYLQDIQNKSIYDAEIVIVIDEYNDIAKEYIEFISEQANFITVIGSLNTEIDETFHNEVYNDFGISLGFCNDYRRLNLKWDIFINLSRKLQMKSLQNKGENGIILDPFFLIAPNEKYKVINNLGLFSQDIVFFNKLNIINNIYSPQLIESLARVRNVSSNQDVRELLKQEIEVNQYALIDS